MSNANKYFKEIVEGKFKVSVGSDIVDELIIKLEKEMLPYVAEFNPDCDLSYSLRLLNNEEITERHRMSNCYGNDKESSDGLVCIKSLVERGKLVLKDEDMAQGIGEALYALGIPYKFEFNYLNQAIWTFFIF